jgi:hypothetical protein
MTELLGNVPVNLISVGLLGVLALRRLVRMDRYFELRAVVLTTLLWVLLIYLFVISWPPFLENDCVPDDGGTGFTIHA